jgi:radical SAM superfamily enzyme YgiQ (UPF0313 family)
MKYFINVYENSYGASGRYYTYRLYSGESEDELKRNIIESIKDGWDFVDEISELDSSDYSGSSLNDISSMIEDIIQDYIDEDYGDLTDYNLEISDSYTGLNMALDFYNRYIEVAESDLEHYEEAHFYFYGDYAIGIQNIFPYLVDLGNYGVNLSDEYIKRLYSRIS